MTAVMYRRDADRAGRRDVDGEPSADINRQISRFGLCRGSQGDRIGGPSVKQDESCHHAGGLSGDPINSIHAADRDDAGIVHGIICAAGGDRRRGDLST